jgi:hypothetical protein
MCFSPAPSHTQAVHKKYKDETSQLQSTLSPGRDLNPITYNINIKKMAQFCAVHYASEQNLSCQINSTKAELR